MYCLISEEELTGKEPLDDFPEEDDASGGDGQVHADPERLVDPRRLGQALAHTESYTSYTYND